jgi:branched-chain amino acid transport system permease protein
MNFFILAFISTFGIYLIITLSLNFDSGYGGHVNFGKALGFIVGAFTAAVFPGRIMYILSGTEMGDYIRNNPTIINQFNKFLSMHPLYSIMLFVTTLIVALGIGALIGYLSIYPVLELSGPPVSVLLMSMAEGARILGQYFEPLAGGTIGVGVPDVFAWCGDRTLITSGTIFIISLLVFFYFERLTRSPLGRLLRAVRDNKDCALSIGINIRQLKAKTFMLSTAAAAFAGALYSFYSSVVISEAYTSASWTLIPWVMMIVGGSANNCGTLSGVFIITLFTLLIVIYKDTLRSFIPFDALWLQYLFLGLVLILIMMFKPGGLIKEKSTATLNLKIIKKIKEKTQQSKKTTENNENKTQVKP